MYTGRHALALSIVLGAVAACKNDKATGPSPTSIVGTWQATKVQYVSTTGLGSVDVVAQGGSATLVLNSDQTFSFTCSKCWSDKLLTGTWSVTDVLTLKMGTNNEMQFDATLSGDALSLTGADRDYDFNSDGKGEPGKLNIALAR